MLSKRSSNKKLKLERHHVAIDFGTSGTSCAYSLAGASVDTADIFYVVWPEIQPTIHKTKTAVLLKRKQKCLSDKDNYTHSRISVVRIPDDYEGAVGQVHYQAEAFGDAAITHFARLVDNNDERIRSRKGANDEPELLFCDDIKMSLYHQSAPLSSDNSNSSSNSNSSPSLPFSTQRIQPKNSTVTIPTEKVVAACLEYISQLALDQMNKPLTVKLAHKDAEWVLTVPAIWSNAAKQIMRRAAEAAGIPSENLTLALEPEVAAINLLHDESLTEHFSSSEDVGTRFMVCDGGGGTFDVTMHKLAGVNPFRLSELLPVAGGNWGSQEIDKAFEKEVLAKIFGDRFTQFTRDCPRAHLTLKVEVEQMKRSLLSATNSVDDAVLSLGILGSLANKDELDEDDTEGANLDVLTKKGLEKMVDHFNLSLGLVMDSGHIKVKGAGKIVVPKKLFYDKACSYVFSKLTNLVREHLEKDPIISKIFLVGGFAQCHEFSRAIESALPPIDDSVLFPSSPSMPDSTSRSSLDQKREQAVADVTVHAYSLVFGRSGSGSGFKSSSSASSPKSETITRKGKVRVFTPALPEGSVLCGALRYSHEFAVITSRRARWTFGEVCTKLWDPSKHTDESLKFTDEMDFDAKANKLYWSRDCFAKLVTIGEELQVGSTRTKSFDLTSRKRQEIDMSLYATEKTDAVYYNESHVFKAAEVTLVIPDETFKTVSIELFFGNTEIQIKATAHAPRNRVATPIKSTVDFCYV